MKRRFIFTFLFILICPFYAGAAQEVTIVYQNDLHAWVFPCSTQMGMAGMARRIEPIFKKNPNAFYTMAGDLFTGPILPDNLKGTGALGIWNRFWKAMAHQGFGQRVLISAGNHEFDYGVPEPVSFSSGLLCANLLDRENHPYYTPFKVVKTANGLRVGFIGLLLNKDHRVQKAISKKELRLISPLNAVNRFVPKMGPLDLTVLMVHDDLRNILTLAGRLSPELGVDLILSGHDHVILDPPLEQKHVFIFQAGAMNRYYGILRVRVDNGKVIGMENRMLENIPSPLDRAILRLKEVSDGMKGKEVAILKRSLLGVCTRGRENSLGDFVTDAFRRATRSAVAMTNSGSLRREMWVFPGEARTLREGDFKNMTPFQNHLVVGTVTGAQIRAILEGDAVHFVNQVSGITYSMDADRPEGNRVLEIKIGERPLVADKAYTLTHNSYCARPENMRTYLHLKPGSIQWKKTPLLDYEALIQYARHLKVIDYPSEGAGRIKRLP